MSKKYAAFITALFCVFIFGFGAALLISPDRDFSQQENRYLAKFEAPTLSTLKSGEFMKDFEQYVIDQFPLRDGWIQLKAWCERLVGKQENNGVYLGTDDGQTLFAQYTKPSAEDLAKRVGYVNQLGANVEVPVYFALIPDKSYVWADRLPDRAPLVDDGSTIQESMDLTGEDVTYIDLRDALSGDNVFYRTDHHWSLFGAFQGYEALNQAMGVETVTPEGEPTKVSDSFYGTTYSSSGAGWVKPDEIYTWVSEEGITVTAYPKGQPEPGVLYDKSYLEKKDKYSMFLGGNKPLTVLENPQAQGGKLLVIRDSYSDSLAPFLAQSWQEVHLFDVRYNLNSVQQYVEENHIDQVLVLFSASNFSTESNLFVMSR